MRSSLRIGTPVAWRQLWVLVLLTLGGCGWSATFNQPLKPCPEISADVFMQALRDGAVRGDVDVGGLGALRTLELAIGGNSLRTCRPAAVRGGSQDCRFSRDLVIRSTSPEGGTVHLIVPSGHWFRILRRNPPGACRLLS